MAIKLIKVAKELNVGLHTIVETLHGKGFPDLEDKPTADITDAMLVVLKQEFQKDLAQKQWADKLARPVLKKEPTGDGTSPATGVPTPPTTPPPDKRTSFLPSREDGPRTTPQPVKPDQPPVVKREEPELTTHRERPANRVLGRIDLNPPKPVDTQKTEQTEKEDHITEQSEFYRADAPQLRGLKILGRISLDRPKPDSGTNVSDRNRGGRRAEQSPNSKYSIIDELINKSIETKDKFIDLGNCGLNEIPTDLAGMDWLEGLNLSSRFRHPVTGKWQSSENKGRRNRMRDGQINEIKNITQIKYLAINGCEVQDIRPLANLEKLTELWLNDNKIYSLEALARLKNLYILGINKNEIIDIKPIATLFRLKSLQLNENEIVNIQALSKLTKLKELVLNKNKITDLKPLYSLSNLQSLAIEDNLIEDIYPLSNLSNLESLEANGNRISNIIPLYNLNKLSFIQLDGNPIQDCPIDIWGTNDIRQIRAYFDSLYRQQTEQNDDEEVATRNNEIKLILVGNSGVGKTQLARLLTTGKYGDNRNTTHGISVSRWKIGKQSLKPFAGLPKGFLVNVWDFGGQEYYHGTHHLFLSKQAVYILLWDKATNSNGIFNTKITDEQEAYLNHFHYRYWLESIRYFAPDSPVLIVQNKIDDPLQPKERLSKEDFDIFRIEHDGLHISLKMAQSDDSRFQRLFYQFCVELTELLDRQAKAFTFNRTWLKIRDAVQDLGDGKRNAFSESLQSDAWISLEEFRTACKAIDAQLSEDELYTLPSWLDRIGTLIYYENNPVLNDRVFLKPQWITEGIYKILNQTVLEQKGEFSEQDFHEEIRPYAATFIALMREMEIIFPHPEIENRYVAPQYLPAEHAVEDLFAIAELGLRQSSYQVQVPLFFYRKLMHRLILYFGIEADVTAKYYWKHGIVFVTRGGTRCLIKGLYPEEYQQEGVILIGIEKTSEFANLQREIFERILIILSNREAELGMKIHSPTLGLKSLLPEPAIEGDLDPEAIADQEFYNNPFPSGWAERYLDKGIDIPRWLAVLEVSVGDSAFILYLELCRYAANGMTKITMKNGQVELVKRFECLLDRGTAQPLKVFLSYSHNDLQLMRRLDVHLAPLKRLEKIESWNDRDILPGLDWDYSIKKQLNEADIILLLITADFVASEYIWKKELAIALERVAEGKCRVIPILLQPVDFDGLPFSERQMIPFNEQDSRKLQPVMLWNNPEEGFSEVAKEIRKVITEMSENKEKLY